MTLCMNATQAALVALSISAGLVAGATLAWGFSKHWHGRHLRTARQAALQSSQAALAAQEQVQRARAQIDALTGDLATHKKAVFETEAQLKRARDAERALMLEAERASQAASAQGADTAHGFADTQLMS